MHLIKTLIDNKNTVKGEVNSNHTINKSNQDTSDLIHRGWPELLRGCIGIALSIYVLQKLILDADPSGHITGMVLMVVIIAGIMDYEPFSSMRSLGIISALATGGFFTREIYGSEGSLRGLVPANSQGFLFVEWLQFFLSMLVLVAGSSSQASAHPHTSIIARSMCVLSIAILVAIPRPSLDDGAANNLESQIDGLSLLLLLPAICLKIKYAICSCIIPILDKICHTGLYPLLDKQKTEARSILLMQQKQEILLYIMAWCVLIGLWAHLRDTILLWIQIAWVIVYLSSLRRYSNVIKILNLRKLLFHPPINKMRDEEENLNIPGSASKKTEQTDRDLKKTNASGQSNSSSTSSGSGIVTIDMKMMQKRIQGNSLKT